MGTPSRAQQARKKSKKRHKIEFERKDTRTGDYENKKVSEEISCVHRYCVGVVIIGREPQVTLVYAHCR